MLTPVDLDETIRAKVDPCDWQIIIDANSDKLTTDELYHLHKGPVEYAIAVLIKLGCLERVVH